LNSKIEGDVATEKFRTDKPYFFVVYRDEKLTVPVINTLYFKEVANHDDGTRGYIFRKLIAFENDPEEIFIDAESAKDDVLDFNELLIELGASNAGSLATDPTSARKRSR
jgi:hypothetical protein